MTHDSAGRIALTHGLVANGEGGDPVSGDVLLRDGLIEAVVLAKDRPRTGYDAETINCTGRVIAPGFVDIHCHSDLSLLAYPDNTSRITQGVTTEVVGNCGMSPAPGNHDLAGLAGVIGTIDVVPGLEWGWTDVAGWLDTLDRAPTTTNAAALVGHGSARFAVAGPEGRPLTAGELDALERKILDALDAGCVGASLGLMYAPGEGASAEELARVTGAVAARGGMLSAHLRDYRPATLPASIDEFVGAAHGTSVRLQISHLRAVGGGCGYADVLAHVDLLRVDGIDVAADAYPYISGHATLIQLLPTELRASGPQAVLDAIAEDPAAVARQLSASGSEPRQITVMKAATTPGAAGANLAEVTTGDPWMWLVELLRDNAGLVDVAVESPAWPDVDLAMVTPWISICSDGTALNATHTASVPHPRSWGAFASGYRRMRDLGVPIGEAVRRITVAPANRAGLTSGIAADRRADVVVIDDTRFDETATYRNPASPAAGIDHVFVAGVPVLRNGRTTGARPGRLLGRKASND